jgi:Tol biopolymer transport system component
MTSIGCDEKTISNYEIIRITDYYHDVCPGEKYAPRCSPVDNRLAFIGMHPDSYEDCIWTLDMEDDEYTYLETTDVDSSSFLSWSPDGEYILYSTRENDYILYYIPSDNQSQFIEPVEIPIPEGHKPIMPDWSPDGEWVIYSNYDDGYIWKIKIDGSDATRITKGIYPRWSPDGTMIVFCKDNGSTNYDILTIPSSGGEPVWIVSGEYDEYNPDWSPDGEYIAYVNSKYGIYVCYPSGENKTRIVKCETIIHIGCNFPTWTNNGEYLVFWNDLSINEDDYPEYNQLYKINPKHGWDFQ